MGWSKPSAGATSSALSADMFLLLLVSVTPRESPSFQRGVTNTERNPTEEPMHNHLLAITLIAFLSACTQDPPVYIGSGTYAFISQEDNGPLEGLEDVTVSVDVQAMTFAIEGGDLDVQATLLERAEDDWMESCPTNFAQCSWKP